MRINYKEKKILNQEEISNKDVEYAVEETKLKLQSDILATKRDLQISENTLQELKTTYPFQVDKYFEELENNLSIKKGLDELNKLKEEFGF